MKRCPQCNRVESDNTLAFCRIDGTALIQDSSAEDSGTIRFNSAPVSGEAQTSTLPSALTDPGTTPVQQTTVLPQHAYENTRPLTKRKFWPLIVVLVAAFAVVASVGGFLYSRTKKINTLESIAVMPFVNESGNADLEYLSDGMTETLINSLSQLPNLHIKSRSSVFRYKGKEIDPQKIATELNVQSLLTGRITQRGDQLTLNVELIDPATENVLWGNKYERSSSQLIALQNDVARDISNRVTKLSSADEAKLTKSYTTNPEAYKFFLKGRYFSRQFTLDGFKTGVAAFNRAIDLDPNYALAYAGLSDAYFYASTVHLQPTEALRYE